VIVKPGGTGIFIFDISAKFAPLPPSKLLRDESPSVLFLENSKISLFFMAQIKNIPPLFFNYIWGKQYV
jgi:hypothetical protein